MDYTEARTELSSYVVKLEEDPSSVSLALQNKKIAIAREYLNRVCSMLLEARSDVRSREEELNDANKEYKEKFNRKMMEDRIKILKTISQQTAVIEVDLAAELNKKYIAEKIYNRTVDYFNDVKDKYNDLVYTLKALRDQAHILDQQITIGELFHKNVPSGQPKSVASEKIRFHSSDAKIKEEISNSATGEKSDDF